MSNRRGINTPWSLFFITFITFFTFITSASLAAEVIDLPSMVVTSPPAPAARQPVGPRSVFERKDLLASGKADLNLLIRGATGVHFTQNTAGAASGLTLRGAGGGSGLVTLDGVPLFNNFTGFFSLSHYPLDLLERVQLARGPGGERHGSRALGGSLNLYTRDMSAEQTFLHLEGGSYGALRTHLGGGWENNWGRWTVAGGRTDIFDGISQAETTPGYNDRDGFQMNNALLRWAKDTSELKLNASMYFVNTREEMDGPGLLPDRRLGWRDDPNGLTRQTIWVAQSEGQYAVHKHWETALKMGFTENRSTGLIGRVLQRRFPMDVTSRLWLGHWNNTHRFQFDDKAQDQLSVQWGMEIQYQRGDSPYHLQAAYHESQTLLSPQARMTIDWQDWLVNGEVRVDHYDEFGARPLFNLALGRRLHQDLLVWTKGGIGFRAPAVSERLHPLFGNPHLKPERSAGGEIGGRWRFSERSEIEVTGYYQRYGQLIVLQQDHRTGQIGSTNVPEADVWSAELQLQHEWNDAWQSGVSYTFMSARQSKTGLSVAFRPAQQGVLWIERRWFDTVRVRMDMTYRDGYWANAANSLWLHSAVRLNAQLDYQLDPRLKLYVRGENLNDERTPDLQGFNYVGASVYSGVVMEW